ncbi:cell division protein FtsQ [Bacillus sp. V3-13]|uniref:cell division protein FtsQ/DivIB n=1 Tax=Bacillus sp. V3-13 TaxID=2053728 RepID=UPI000C760721|nr:cell division protein FtsQ/DivIB [Bacillus sp. V3-13]PLR77481.1 cell division protein FtsQ [Bacillus sp. V3-13]
MGKGNVVSLEDRIPKLKQQRRRKANRRLIFLLMLFFSLIVCVVYFQSPLSHVKKITVSGNELYSQEDLISLSKLSSKTNIWKVDSKSIEGKLSELPEIESVDVSIQIPNSVLIKVKEHSRIAYVANETSYLPVLDNGFIVKQKETTGLPVNAPILSGFAEGDILAEMIDGLEVLPEEVLNAISEIHYSPTETDAHRITLFMNDGFEVNATLRSFAEKMVHYPSIVSQLDPGKKGVIDLEVGSYFKGYGSEGAEMKNDEGER